MNKQFFFFWKPLWYSIFSYLKFTISFPLKKMSRSKARRRGEQPIWKGSLGKNNDNHQAHKSDNGGIQQRWNPIWHKEQLKTMHKMV
jgi:hypothetical protein